MTDDVPTWLRKTRPHTEADDGWAASADGEAALAAIHEATEGGRELRRMRILIGHPGLVAAGAVAAVAAVVVGVVAAQPPHRAHPGQPVAQVPGPRPTDMALVSYDTCAQLLSGLRDHAAKVVGPSGLPGEWNGPALLARDALPMAAAAMGGASNATPEHSTTNVQEAGVDEPDIVKNDGRRIVSVSNGVLRVVDAEQRKVVGQLDLTLYDGWQSARLLLSGDRALVVLDSAGPYFGGMRPAGSVGSSSAYLLVDISRAPRLIGTVHPNGGYVDARMVGSTVRLVVSSRPKITFGDPNARTAEAHNRAVIRRAPLSAWLPSYDVSTGGVTTTRTVPCHSVSHPAQYTGASMLSIYTIDLAQGLGDLQPVSVAADGDTVYATDASLYVASNPDWYVGDGGRQRTELHRFDISQPGAPTYLGSGSVPGRLLSQYSLSDYEGYLRVAATTYARTSQTGVYVLDANTLTVTGHVGGLGPAEQVYAVRFLGPLGYVVTFRQMDPLYVIDLSNPAAPRTAGEVKMSGYSAYLHPVGNGRLVGVGQDATASGQVTGLQVSLFDVSDPARPQRMARVVRRGDLGGMSLDPHAFLYWPQSGLLVVPTGAWEGGDAGKALVLDVGRNTLTTLGLISHPGLSQGDGIQRGLVIGDSLWTMSSAGLRATDLHSLHPQAWVPFS